MNPLLPLSSMRLGPVANDAPRVTAGSTPDGARWRVTWTSVLGECREATAPIAAGDWTDSAPLPAGRPTDGTASEGMRSSGVLCTAGYSHGLVALRSGRRVVGERPTFPGASLVISRQVAADWVDLAFADETPDQAILAAAMAVRGDDLLGVWVAADGQGEAVCRAVRFSLRSPDARGDAWRNYPAFPLSPGVAAAMAGVHDGVLIAAGGANFPDRPPWENGVKKTYDEIYALPPGAAEWKTVGRLPEPRAYAAVVSVPQGVLAVGGENASGVFHDSLLLSWDGRGVAVEAAPAPPVALASPVAVVLAGSVYLAGGYTAGTPRVSTSGFYRLDLGNLAAGWQQLPSWPGPSRALAVIAALDGAIYLASGLEMLAGADGQPRIRYLTDAYRYCPGQGWNELPDLPWSVIAAPSPAPVTGSPGRVFMFGGVDGRQVGKMPRDRRVPEDILYFDVARQAWLLWKERWPEPVVSSPTVRVGDEWIFVSGETKAGHRTTVVMGWRPV
jgi:N-acetylneuraminate epimerase